MKKLSVFVKAFFRILFTILAVLLAVLATVITCSLRWMFDTWSNLTMDELIYHLTSPLDGTNDAMIREYIDTCIVPAVIVLLFLLVLFAAFRKKKRYYIVMAGAIVLSVSVGALSVRGAWQDLDVGNYVGQGNLLHLYRRQLCESVGCGADLPSGEEKPDLHLP